MKLNLFEGARRLLRLGQGLWLLVVPFFAWDGRPHVTINRDVLAFHEASVPATRDCGDADRAHLVDVISASGTRAVVWLCFRAQRFPDGQMLIPVREDPENKGKILGADRLSADVAEYVEAYERLHKVFADDREIESAWRAARWKQIWEGLAFAVGGTLLLSLSAAVVGWIVRGFLGIPRGRDSALPIHRPGERPRL